MLHNLKPLSLALAATALSAVASAQSYTVDFDTLATPPAGNVGPAQRVYQEAGPGGFTLLRIADPSDASTLGNHFHTTLGNGSSGHANTTAAEFFSDDGSPFMYYLGDYSGTTNATYAPVTSTERAFSLTSFTILSLSGTYALTASNGSTLAIDHTGIYTGTALAGFQNILSYRHDYTGATDGYMVVDDIKVQAAPEPASLVALGLGALALVRRRRAR